MGTRAYSETLPRGTTMLSQLAILILAFTTTGTSEQDAQLKWSRHYENAKQVARAEQRPLVVVIEDSTKNADFNVDAKTKEVLLEKNFQLVKVDVRTKYGREVAKAFGAQEFPYTIVTNGDCTEIAFRQAGPMTVWDWAFALGKSLDSIGGRTDEPNKLHWSSHYDDAKRLAMEAKRPLLVVIEKATESDFEKNLDCELKGFLLQKNFQLVRVDADSEYGCKVATAFGATKFPYTVVTKSDASEIVFRRSGEMAKRHWRKAFAKCFDQEMERPTKNRSVIVKETTRQKKEIRVASVPSTVLVTRRTDVVSMPQSAASVKFAPALSFASQFSPNFGSYGLAASSQCSAST